MTAIKEWKRCRSCGSPYLEPLFSLGDQYVNDFVPPGQAYMGQRVPITLDLCRACSLVQARYTAPQDFLYLRKYWYRSGVTKTMRDALRDITGSIEKRVALESGDIVLDIGSNDGTLLRSYENPNLFTVGFEPATNLAEEGRQGISAFINDFWSYLSYKTGIGTKAKVITAIGMFYDLDDPNQFISDVAKALAHDGVFVAQLMCLQNMLELHDVGNLAHEHLEYYSLQSLDYLLHQHGLEIFDVEKNDVNGSSYRLWIKHKASTSVQSPPGSALRLTTAYVAERGLDKVETYRRWFNEVETQRQLCRDFVLSAVERGQTVWVYGASTKGNVILQYYGLDHHVIGGAAERSPEKWSLRTIGTDIPIYSEEDARAANPDYFLVLPYAFLPEFYEREVAWRSKGGKFLVPLPEFKVVS